MSSDLTLYIKAKNEATAALQAVKGDLAQVGQAAGGLSQTMKSAGAAVRNVGMGMTAGVTLPLMAIGGAALNSAAEFEQALNVMQQVSGATAGEMAALQAQALQLGAETAFSAGEAADAMLELGKAGMNATEVMAALPGVLDLAAAGGVDMATAAGLTSAALNAFGLEASASTEIANMFAAAANASAADISDLGQGFQQAGFAFAASKQSAADLTASLAILTNVGLTGSDAGTALKNAMMRLMNPTKEAAELMNTLGINAYDAQGKMLPWADVIQEFSDATAGMTDEQRQAALSTILMGDGMKAMLPLLDAGKSGYLEMKAAVGVQGAATAVADARMRGMAGAVEYFKGSVDSFLIGTALPWLDTMSGIVRQVADGITWLGALPEPVKQAGLAFAVAAAAIGPLLIGLGMLSSTIGAALPVLGAVGGAIVALASPVGLVIAAVAGLGVAWATNFMGIQDATMPVINAVVGGFNTALAAVQKFGASATWTGLVSTVGGALATIGAAIGGVFSGELSLPDLAGRIGEQFNVIAQAVRDAAAGADLGSLRESLVGALGLDTIDLGALTQGLQEFVQNIVTTITGFDYGGAFTGLVTAVTDFVTGIDWLPVTTGFETLRATVVGAITAIDWGGALATAGEWLGGLTTWAVAQITAIDWGTGLATAGEWLSTLTSWVGTQIAAIDWGGALTTAGSFLDGFKNGVVGALTTIDWGGALATAGSFLDGFKNGVVGAITTIDWGGALTAAGDTATGLRDGVFNWLTTAIGGVNWSGASLDFAGMIGAVTTSIQSVDWSSIQAEDVFAALVLPVTAALAGINWLINNESFQGLATAVVAAVTTIDWGAIGGSLVSLGTAVVGAITGLDWSNVTGAVEGLKTSAVAAITGIDWGGALTAAGSFLDGLKNGVIGAVTTIDWGGALTTAGSFLNGLRDGVLANLTTTFTGLDVTGVFTGMLASITNEISTTDWSAIGKGLGTAVTAALTGIVWLFSPSTWAGMLSAVTSALATAMNPESLKAGAVAAFVTLAPAIAAGLAGVVWVFSSENWAGLGTAIKNSLTTINWDEVGASFEKLKTAVVTGLGDFVTGFTGGFTWMWPELPKFTWPELPKFSWPTLPKFEWPTLPKFEWPTLPQWTWPSLPEFHWPVFPEFHWPSFSWPALPWPLGGQQLGTSYFGGGATWVGEAGPEMVVLPRGAEVIPNRKAEKLGRAGVNVTVQQMIVRDDRDIYAFAYQVADILARA